MHQCTPVETRCSLLNLRKPMKCSKSPVNSFCNLLKHPWSPQDTLTLPKMPMHWKDRKYSWRSIKDPSKPPEILWNPMKSSERPWNYCPPENIRNHNETSWNAPEILVASWKHLILPESFWSSAKPQEMALIVLGGPKTYWKPLEFLRMLLNLLKHLYEPFWNNLKSSELREKSLKHSEAWNRLQSPKTL